MPAGPSQSVNPLLVTAKTPLGRYWDELPSSTRRYFHGHPSLQAQLYGGGAPKPTPTSNEQPLIQGTMRTFPDVHPSLGSVKNQVAMGCPATVFNQMDSNQWKSTTQATVWEQEPTARKRREGKKTPPALHGTEELFIEPRESYVVPAGAPPTIYRDQRVFKHMGTLTRAGKW